jgi:predicted phage baseplate assembly protein
MPLPDIQLDDRRFEDLVSDARRRIPGYTPEWTDLNESDPGMTLVQLFAWLEEMILWRLNRVPEKNFLKFLELIGIELNPPVPAVSELTFKLSTPDPPAPGYVVIPQGTKVSPSEQSDSTPIIFETDDNLYAVGATLTALQSFDSAQFQVLTEANRIDGKFFYPFGPRPQKDAAFYLGFDRPFPEEGPKPYALTIHAYIGNLIEEGKGIGADLPIAAPSAIAVWEYWVGDLGKWHRLDVKGDTTNGLTRTGTLLFLAPKGMQATQLGLLRKDEDKPLFWFRCRIDQVLGAGYEVPPQLEDLLINTISATNAVTVRDEFLGGSDGSPNQVFRLANKPVLPKGFVLEVDEGEGFEPWTMVADFAASNRTDRHYTLNPATGEVAFGNGEQGRIPARLTTADRPDQDLANVKATTYRWGGGARGNVGAKKITSLQSPVPYVDSVTNARSAVGGQDEETVDQAKQRAPETIRSQSRAVTADDFEFLARQTPGARIRRAHALPLRHPDLEPVRPVGAGVGATSLPVPGVVTVMIVPDSLGSKPIPSPEILVLVARWLNDHRLITTEVHVAPPKYRQVEIEARVIVDPSASSALVEEALKQKLLDYFHPLRGGNNGTGWEFGGTIYFSETYRLILDTPGVARVEGGAVTTYVDEQRMDPCKDIPLKPDELVFSEKQTVFATYS